MRCPWAQVKAAKAAAFAATVRPVIIELKAIGFSLHKIAKTLNDRDVRTASGAGAWTATSVRRVLMRQPDKQQV